jgi:hypothetical protein
MIYHPFEKLGGSVGQGAHNTLSTLAHTHALRTLFAKALQQCCAVFAHRVRRVKKVGVALEPIGVASCLQIRLAQFDSGSRLQKSCRYCSRSNGIFCFYIASDSKAYYCAL